MVYTRLMCNLIDGIFEVLHLSGAVVWYLVLLVATTLDEVVIYGPHVVERNPMAVIWPTSIVTTISLEEGVCVGATCNSIRSNHTSTASVLTIVLVPVAISSK